MRENQASPRRTLSKNWVHAVGANKRKNPKRAHSTIAPPVCVSLRDVGTWLDTFLRRRRRPASSEASGTEDTLSPCPEFDSSLTPPRLCLLLFSSGQDSPRSVSKDLSPAAGGEAPRHHQKATCGEDGRPRIAESRPWHVGAPKGEDEQRLFTRRRWPERFLPVSSVMGRRRLLLISVCPALSGGVGMTICLFSDSGGSPSLAWRLLCLSASWQEG